MKALLAEAQKNNVFIHRVTQTKGIMLLSDDEIVITSEEGEKAGITLSKKNKIIIS